LIYPLTASRIGKEHVIIRLLPCLNIPSDSGSRIPHIEAPLRMTNAGQHSNAGTATGKPPGALSPVSGTDFSHYFGADPRIGLEKHTNGKDADHLPGSAIPLSETMTWTSA
jgi:hypothetical protein